MKRNTITKAALVLILTSPLFASAPRYEVEFPDIMDLQTLVCDFHTHTVFSDGSVWPEVRMDEAWREGIDVIALSDHIEYQPHKNDIPTNHNKPYEIAKGAAYAQNLLLIKAAEITRSTPPGHFNALFLNDINPLQVDGFLDAVKAANDQNAFVFWNHQGWQGEERGSWREVHTTLYDNGWLHGMEVCNEYDYYPSAHQWILDKNFTFLGNSDIHGPSSDRIRTPDNHRTMTLVFAKERTLEEVHNALKQRRSVVWYKNQIIGREEHLTPMFAGCIKVHPPHYRTDKHFWFRIENKCELDIELKATGDTKPNTLSLPSKVTTLVRLRIDPAKPTKELTYQATNFLIGVDKYLPVTITIPEMAVVE